MKTTAEQNERRLRAAWYLGLLALPVLILWILTSLDPYRKVQLNQVLELRQTLNERGVGQEVIAYLDRHGGQNLSEVELARLQEADGADIYFMLRSAQASKGLKMFVDMALEDGYITRGEAEDYHTMAQRELTRPEVLSHFGF